MNKRITVALCFIGLLAYNESEGQVSGRGQENLLKKKELPGEYSAEQILNGEYQWPASPEITMEALDSPFFVKDAFGTVPEPGVHPRILFSPEDLEDIRNRSKNTKTGRLALKNLRAYQDISIRKEHTASYNVYQALLAGNIKKAKGLLDNYPKAGEGDGVSWHHRPQFLYVLLLETFDCLLRDDTEKGAELATVITNLGKIYQKNLDQMDRAFKSASEILSQGGDDGNALKFNSQLNSDVWRSGRKDAIGGEPYFAFLYDFAYNWMNKRQQKSCRNLLNTYTKGKTAMGSHMPHHFRNWNWIAVGSGLLLTSLATEGEEGNDARVYEHQKEVQTDYQKYGWSEMGMSKEAIGYTQFGLRWHGPALVAMARRGHNLWNQKRWYNSLKWYANSVQPGGARFISHGDGGEAGPTLQTLLAWKRSYPQDPLVNYVLQETLAYQNGGGDKLDGGRGYVMYQIIFADDPLPTDFEAGKRLGLPNTYFDPERKSLITRSNWGDDEVQLQLECRDDQIGPSHQHADRGNFTFSGAGRAWAIDRFRGIESRHHNCVIIDGKGQGYVPPPGEWLGLVDNDDATFGVLNAKYAYDWYWQGTLSGFADKDQPRRRFKRWEYLTGETDKWLAKHPNFDWKANIDRSPVVEAYYNGFESGDPRMWDEYARPVRVKHNPVEKAFRSAGLVRGAHPYALVVDDIQKDSKDHTYEWIMMVDSDVEMLSLQIDEIILGGDTKRTEGAWGTLKFEPKEGDAQLLVKVLDRTVPEDIFKNPQIRLETFEYKDARDWPDGRSFGMAKRLVIPSYGVNPNFKMLLFPYYHGEEKPLIKWNESKTEVSIEWQDQKDRVIFKENEKGRTTYKVIRNGKVIAEI
ncbi:hypothetical protein SAMN05421766_10955 [Zobellia uliginosa]|uniref:Heparinase II/III-like protein n=1 Tax=Zobellia uliginosa TaxID=143224 RepID=A0ABY1L1B7_9FLAO|nr:hypothetical protein [Zobellia uliginosa]SIT08800.1 hypothetical protein SAMN05421766_10955 [Zobellia uliginosa]